MNKTYNQSLNSWSLKFLAVSISQVVYFGRITRQDIFFQNHAVGGRGSVSPGAKKFVTRFNNTIIQQYLNQTSFLTKFAFQYNRCNRNHYIVSIIHSYGLLSGYYQIIFVFFIIFYLDLPTGIHDKQYSQATAKHFSIITCSRLPCDRFMSLSETQYNLYIRIVVMWLTVISLF